MHAPTDPYHIWDHKLRMVDQVGTFPTQGGATALIELHYLPMLYNYTSSLDLVGT